ncbi:MBL fold metallo-hydrolase [Erysipelotrichaceae bacterium AF15-26LB]|nr:metallo-beta-lactamase domain protein [Erysipelotrichaceae bacterium 3_1_53]MCR0348614.1 MBL fold metallo-hydrolase [[Clostridium] innocuum]RJV89084.1 MBL fold metallo-hydrolase [Erysipelotrichaceae bacterium AF19-24AC]RJV91491.1 MBL fold metallo-hydrolase [Erysipelotrichaceae bacterium AF15-26LB]
MKLRNRIYQLTGAEYGTLGSVYAIAYKDGYILIDTGMPDALDVMKRTMAYWSIDECKITHVFLTHGHDDHCGNAAYFQKLGAEIIIGEEDAVMLKSGCLGKNSPCINHIMPPCDPDYLITKDESFLIGDIRLQAYKMPGHTNGTVLYIAEIDKETVVFSGDFFYPCGERGEFAQTGWKGDLTYNPDNMTKSFTRLYEMELKPDMILSSHGVPLFGEKAKSCIQIAFKYHILNNR